MGAQQTIPQPDCIIQAISQLRLELSKLQSKTEDKSKTQPTANLRVITNHNRPQYYIINPNNASNGTYLPHKEIHKAVAIAQRDYNNTIATILKKQIKAIDSFLTAYDPNDLDNAFTKLHPGRRALVTPVREPNEDFIAAWQHHPYTGKPFEINAPEYYTSTGIRVRSKSEVIIADALSRSSIPYRYEYPTSIKGWGTLYPDFTCLDIRSREEIIWEHFGLMNDPDYVENAVQKIAHYAASGYTLGKNFIATFESNSAPFSVKQVQSYIKAIFKHNIPHQQN